MAKWAILLQVSRSGYYQWLSQREADLAKEKEEKEQIKRIFDEGEGSYGPERICGIIRERGGHMGRDKCSRHMAVMGLNSVHNKRRTRSLTNSKKARGDGYPNLLRLEYPIVSRMALSSDITYLRSSEGFEYLCIIKDVVSGEILGRCCAPKMTKELVINAFMGMLSRYGNELKEGFIFHSDRGSQYTSKAFMELVKGSGGRQSFSRLGTPGDNAWSESFFANMKKEKFHWTHFETREKIRAVVFEYIEVFYNGKRAQKRLGYLSPRKYLERLQIEELLLVA